jgi:hypothetical protein
MTTSNWYGNQGGSWGSTTGPVSAGSVTRDDQLFLQQMMRQTGASGSQYINSLIGGTPDQTRNLFSTLQGQADPYDMQAAISNYDPSAYNGQFSQYFTNNNGAWSPNSATSTQTGQNGGNVSIFNSPANAQTNLGTLGQGASFADLGNPTATGGDYVGAYGSSAYSPYNPSGTGTQTLGSIAKPAGTLAQPHGAGVGAGIGAPATGAQGPAKSAVNPSGITTVPGSGLNALPLDINSYLDPSMAFRIQQGENALQNSAAARGHLLSGATMKGISDYAQNTAQQAYSDAEQRAAQQQGYKTGIDTSNRDFTYKANTGDRDFFSNQGNIDRQFDYNAQTGDRAFNYNRLSDIAHMGLTGAQGDSALAIALAGILSGNTMTGGTAGAAGAVGNANTVNGTISSIIRNWLTGQAVNQ